MVYAAVLGYGTVGSGVVEILERNREIIKKRVGEEIKVKYVLDLRDFEGQPVQELIVHDFDLILKDDDVKIIAESMGGLNPAYSFVKKALESGKSVTTSNKELVAAYGAELIKTAKANGANFLFEASVGGGIPILRSLNQCLTADEITQISGILNGTTNYMLTKMTDEGLEYDDVLKQAQSMGYAEKDPTNDVEGYDSCRKTAILASIITGKRVDYEDIYTEGITNISKTDIEYAKKLGGKIKLLACAEKTDNGVWARVCPVITNKKNPLSTVDDVFNSVLVEGNMVDKVMFYGRGAGKLPTASAVVSDIIDEAKNLGSDITFGWQEDKLDILSIDDISVSKLIRVEYNDKAKAKDAVMRIFGDVAVTELEEDNGEFAFISPKQTERNVNKKINSLLNEDGISNVLGAIRAEN